MSESVLQIREQGSGELRVARSVPICTASKALYKDNKIILNSFLALHYVLW